MKFRKRLSKKHSKRLFRKTVGYVHKKNFSSHRHMSRGGTRL